MEAAALPLSKLGLPITDLIDFVTDIGANSANLSDHDEQVQQMGLYGFIALAISCCTNSIMLFMHYRRFKKLYQDLLSRSFILKIAFFVWMPVSCTNIEVVIIYIAFVKVFFGRFELGFGIKRGDANFLPRAVRNDMQAAIMHAEKLSLFSQLTENLPELVFQGRACLIMMWADEPRIPGNWQLFSLFLSFTMLFAKLLIGMLRFAVDVGVPRRVLKQFLRQGIPTTSSTAEGKTRKDLEDWRQIKWQRVSKVTYFVCGLSCIVTFCTAAFFGESILYAEFKKEDLLEVVIIGYFSGGLFTLAMFFLATRLVVQELDFCWQVNLHLHKSAFILMCSLFSSDILEVIHQNLVVAARRHIFGFLPVIRSIFFVVFLAEIDLYPKQMKEVLGRHSITSQRFTLLMANLGMAVVHVILFLYGCYQERPKINPQGPRNLGRCGNAEGEYHEVGQTDQNSPHFTTVEKLREAHEHLEQMHTEQIHTLIGKETSSDDELSDVLEKALVVFDESHSTYQELINFKRQREEFPTRIKRAQESVGSAELKQLAQDNRTMFGLSNFLLPELQAREKAENSLEKALSEPSGSQVLNELILTLSEVKINFERAKIEVENRVVAEKQLSDSIVETVGSDALLTVLQGLRGKRISFEIAETEVGNRSAAEKQLSDAMAETVGSDAFQTVVQRLRGYRISFEIAEIEAEKRAVAEKQLSDAVLETVGSDALKNRIQSLAGIRINFAMAESEAEKRSVAEKKLSDALSEPRFEDFRSIIRSLEGTRISFESTKKREEAEVPAAKKRIAKAGLKWKATEVDWDQKKAATDDLVYDLSISAPGLVKAILTNIAVTDVAIKEVAAHCPNLATIHLSQTKVTDAGVKELAQRCPKLEYIDLRETMVTDSGAQEVAQHCPNLKEICLYNTTVGDSGVKDLAKGCPNLKDINLFMTSVADAGVKEIANSCPNLDTIDLRDTRVTDAGIKEILQKCPKLKKMHWKDLQEQENLNELKKKFGI